jgi:hypothetical protein
MIRGGAMPVVSEQTLAELDELLLTGPLVIGENHELPHARGAVLELMRRGSVRFLSLECPIVPPNMMRADGQLDVNSVDSYFCNWSGMRNEVTVREVVEYAISHRVAVYFHDVPCAKSPLNFATDQNDTSVYPKHARTFLPTSMNNLPLNNGNAGTIYRQRDEYAAKFLKTQLGNGVNVLRGLVVLAGSFHLMSDATNGFASTLQGCLGIIEKRRAHIVE